jgi:hypothetical protein
MNDKPSLSSLEVLQSLRIGGKRETLLTKLPSTFPDHSALRRLSFRVRFADALDIRQHRDSDSPSYLAATSDQDWTGLDAVLCRPFQEIELIIPPTVIGFEGASRIVQAAMPNYGLGDWAC